MRGGKAFVRIVATVAALAAANMVGAISNGTVDDPNNPRYPAVGMIGWHFVGWTRAHVASGCGGFLIAPTVVLGVGHCAYLVNQAFEAGSVDAVWVSFGVDLSPTFPWESWPAASAQAVPVREIHLHPSFRPQFSERNPVLGNALSFQSGDDPGDLAVYILSEPYTGVLPMALPEAGLLDMLREHHGLQDQEFGIVGYGYEMFFDPGQAPYLAGGKIRTYSQSRFLALGPDWLFLAMNEETGNGGACGGDSGGPAVLRRCDAEGVCTDVAMGTLSFADGMCRSIGKWGRLDTDSARAFLGQYVSLP